MTLALTLVKPHKAAHAQGVEETQIALSYQTRVDVTKAPDNREDRYYGQIKKYKV